MEIIRDERGMLGYGIKGRSLGQMHREDHGALVQVRVIGVNRHGVGWAERTGWRRHRVVGQDWHRFRDDWLLPCMRGVLQDET